MALAPPLQASKMISRKYLYSKIRIFFYAKILRVSNLDKLISHFEKFPGIGGRQAKRFAFHILTSNPAQVDELADLIKSLHTTVIECASCHRFFSHSGGSETLCNICTGHNRDHSKLMVVAADSDINAIERSGVYDGLYFVLGGTVPLLHSEDTKRLRGGSLKSTVEARIPAGLTEVILAFAVNPDGENTARYVESIVTPVIENDSASICKISHLGRGLSTGSELEYADPDTIKNALQNRN
jgi:recombination protein RecR